MCECTYSGLARFGTLAWCCVEDEERTVIGIYNTDVDGLLWEIE